MKCKSFPKIGEELYSCTLENGLEIRVVPKKDFATRYACFATNYGGVHRRFTVDGAAVDTPAGVAHFLEHKMFDLPDGGNALNILSARGADPNAFTSSSMTCYHFQCTEGFEDNLRLLLQFVSTPYFTDETVEKEQGIIAQEIRMGEDSPGSILYYNLLSLLYNEHPIKDKVAGSVESISEITAKTLYDCHRIFYAPSNMVLCVEGDVDPETVERIAGELLPAEKAPVPHAYLGKDEGLLPIESFKSQEVEIAATQFLIGAKLKPETDGEKALRQRLVAELSLRMLCGSSSDFYTRLYEQGLINLSFDCEAEFVADTGFVLLGGESPDCQRVLSEFIKEAERIGDEGFDEGLFNRSKRAGLGARLRGLEDFDNVCVSLACGVFDGFCAMDSIELLDDISMEECRLFVRDNLKAERLAMSVILPKATEE